MFDKQMNSDRLTIDGNLHVQGKFIFRIVKKILKRKKDIMLVIKEVAQAVLKRITMSRNIWMINLEMILIFLIRNLMRLLLFRLEME
jgi:hypothetical protein